MYSIEKVRSIYFFTIAQWYDDQMTTKGIPHSEYIMSIQSRSVSALSDLSLLLLKCPNQSAETLLTSSITSRYLTTPICSILHTPST
jgi:hypothetical protein